MPLSHSSPLINDAGEDIKCGAAAGFKFGSDDKLARAGVEGQLCLGALLSIESDR